MYKRQDETLHEIHIGPYVADAVTGDGMILEIQTQAFSSMKKKLDAFLNSYEVTIIYPVASVRWVSHFDPESGVLSGRRKDRRHADEWQIFQELMSIREYLRRPNLHFLIALLQTEEYRMKGDRRNARYDRLPTALLKEVGIFSLRDYACLLYTSCIGFIFRFFSILAAAFLHPAFLYIHLNRIANVIGILFYKTLNCIGIQKLIIVIVIGIRLNKECNG